MGSERGPRNCPAFALPGLTGNGQGQELTTRGHLERDREGWAVGRGAEPRPGCGQEAEGGRTIPARPSPGATRGSEALLSGVPGWDWLQGPPRRAGSCRAEPLAPPGHRKRRVQPAGPQPQGARSQGGEAAERAPRLGGWRRGRTKHRTCPSWEPGPRARPPPDATGPSRQRAPPPRLSGIQRARPAGAARPLAAD